MHTQINDVIGCLQRIMCNTSGNQLGSFLDETKTDDLCNGKKLVFEPEWTRVKLSLKQKSM